jgi:hypothetical protein
VQGRGEYTITNQLQPSLNVSRRFTTGEALDILAEADSMMASGAHRADVCRQLGISHQLYERFVWKYRPAGGRSSVAGEQAPRFMIPI